MKSTLAFLLILSSSTFAEENLISIEDWQTSDAQKRYVTSLVTEAGQEVSDIWYDTILEGGYSLIGDITVDDIQIELEDGRAVRFHAYVSSGAFFDGNCDYIEEIEGYEQECIDENSGTISEPFVTNWRKEILDSDGYAEFDHD